MMKIGQLAVRTGVSERMLRYYESAGLLRPARTAAGYRDYSAGDVAVVRRIVLLNRAGLRLAIIRRVLPCALPGPVGTAPCAALRDRISEQLNAIDRQIAELNESRKLLASIVAPASRDP